MTPDLARRRPWLRAPADTRRSKGVDIILTKDMLSHAFPGNFDAALLVAGDGD